MVHLGVNIDHIATLRQQRHAPYPSLIDAARVVEDAGAYGLTVHLREDRRHIQDKDVYDLRKNIGIKLNLEMSVNPKIVDIACDLKPHDVCIVPEKRQELTTEGGLNILADKTNIERVVKKLKDNGIRVSLFIDPELDSVKAARDVGAEVVELHTGCYADAVSKEKSDFEFKRIEDASNFAVDLGLVLNAGHGLDYDNTERIAKIKGLNELNIGYSIVSRAVFVGIDRAVREMINLIKTQE